MRAAVSLLDPPPHESFDNVQEGPSNVDEQRSNPPSNEHSSTQTDDMEIDELAEEAMEELEQEETGQVNDILMPHSGQTTSEEPSSNESLPPPPPRNRSVAPSPSS